MDSAGNTTLLGGVVGSGGAAGEIIFVGATPFESDPNLFWDDTNKRLGVRTATPVTVFHAYTTAVENAGIFEIAVSDHSAYNVLALRRTRADTTPPNAGFGAGIAFVAEGFTSGVIANIGIIRAFWENNQTNDTTDRDSAVSFFTTLDNTSGEKMRLTSAGFLGIRETAPESPIHAVFSATTNFVAIFENDTNTHDSLATLTLRRTRADGTAPNAGFGTGFICQLQGANDANVNAALVVTQWEVNQTDDTTARDSMMLFYLVSDASLVERLRLTSAGRLQVPVTGSGAGVLIGGDTLLYRSAADILRTPDSLTVDVGLNIGAATGAVAGTWRAKVGTGEQIWMRPPADFGAGYGPIIQAVDTTSSSSIQLVLAGSSVRILNELRLDISVSATASAGGGATLPATVAGYLVVNVAGTNRKVPYYAT